MRSSKNAPTNNLITERRLSVFSKRSKMAKYKTSNHTGELLRDNMVLVHAEAKSVDKRAHLIHKALGDVNVKWLSVQKEIQLMKIKEKIVKKEKSVDYVLKRMEGCKV